jgi:hypothetical protein
MEPENSLPYSEQPTPGPHSDLVESISQPYTIVYLIFSLILSSYLCRDSSVGVALEYGLDDRGSKVRFPARAWNFSLHRRVQNGSGAHPQPPIQWVPGTISLGVKWPGCEAEIRLHGVVFR